ncbi:hypothetical protein G7Z17_g5523 [Cylindrodendrum hubeiense]|uniref:Uncharacterized protein n=1 Tax=Cylindrodendrum hubeiense TaxID=595255 RepID=A0A9P5LH88_9HYPO|nr:hypothetical protein G7Z17_g5523 [Cylindrodendrum hubeiense]
MDPVIDSIAQWASQDDRVLVGHVQGPAITSRSSSEFSIPLAIRQALSFRSPEILVVHVTYDLKVAEIHEQNSRIHEQLSSTILQIERMTPWVKLHTVEPNNAATFQLATESYRSLLKKLRENRDPMDDPCQPQDWERSSVLPPQVLFVVDLDPDFSTEFALLTAVLTAWATMAPKKRTAVRILTMSADPIHHVLSGLYHAQCLDPIAKFAAGPVGNPAEIIEVDRDDNNVNIMSAMLKNVDLNPNSSHTVLCFRPVAAASERFLEGWRKEELAPDEFIRYGFADDNKSTRRVLQLQVGARLPDRLTGSDYVHIITGETRQRQIFDHKINQVAEVNLKISASERQEQVDWASRVDCLGSQVIVYTNKDFWEGANATRPRRLFAADLQLSGLLAGLTEFADCPMQTPYFIVLVTMINPVGAWQIIRRLNLQKLMHMEGHGFPRLDIPEAIHGRFYDALPLVNYDARLAWFISMPSQSPTCALVKLQLAAVLTTGINDLISVDPTPDIIDELLDTARCGLAGSYVDRGMLWLLLGLIKKAFCETRNEVGWGSGIFTTPEFELLEGVVSVNLIHAKRVMHSIEVLKKWASRHHVELADGEIRNEPLSMTSDGFLEISWDLLRAFVHQTACVKLPATEQWQIQDTQSFKTLNDKGMTYILCDWDVIEAHDTEVATGIHTHRISPSADVDVLVLDWTWIPFSLLKRWGREFGRLDAIAGYYLGSPNPDEA